MKTPSINTNLFTDPSNETSHRQLCLVLDDFTMLQVQRLAERIEKRGQRVASETKLIEAQREQLTRDNQTITQEAVRLSQRGDELALQEQQVTNGARASGLVGAQGSGLAGARGSGLAGAQGSG